MILPIPFLLMLLAGVSSAEFLTDLEGIVYSVVEYFPGVGTLYSVERAAYIATHDGFDREFWVTMANAGESAVRDGVMLFSLVEPSKITIMHTMAEALTDKMISLYAGNEAKLETKAPKDASREHVFIAEKDQGAVGDPFFKGAPKGVHHYYDSEFMGSFSNAFNTGTGPNGYCIKLKFPRGLANNAPFTLEKWPRSQFLGAKVRRAIRETDSCGPSTDPAKQPKKYDIISGHVELKEGSGKQMSLVGTKGTSGPERVDFDLFNFDVMGWTGPVTLGSENLNARLSRVTKK